MTEKRINLISGPRNISTALMYSFNSRPDTEVVDEPMYAYYLNASGVVHPGREEILKALPKDLNEVVESLLYKNTKTPYYFIKGMAHHYYGVDPSFILPLENVFLIRDPVLLITSFQKVISQPTMQDIGLCKEYELYSFLIENGRVPAVLDSGELLKDPQGVLEKLCQQLDIPFDYRMLSWPAGPKKVDGVWAPYWYASVHKSTGFQRSKNADVDFPESLRDLLEEALPYYEKLFSSAIKA